MTATREEKVRLVEKRISNISANNPMVISFSEQTLERLLSDRLIRKIAEEAVDALTGII